MWDVNNRKREGVIIMKKTMYNKKGFTLAEMLLVIGIIVILSGATAIGVISWVNNAKNTAANLEANNGDHFEQEALESVKKIAGTAGSHVINQTNLDTPAPTTPKPTTKPNNNDDPNPPADPTPVPATPTPEPTPTTAPDNGGGNGGGNSGGGNISSDVVSSVGGYNYWNNESGTMNVGINQDSIKNANTITLTFKVNSGNITTINNLGNYNPSISYNGSTATVVIKKSDVPDWMRNNWNNGNFGNLDPQFALSGGSNTSVSLVGASYSR